MSAFLQVSGLGSGYGDVRILHGVDIAVAAGSITGLIGANGAGKTTLMRCLAGLLSSTSGSIRLEAQSVEPLASHARVELGVVLVPEGRLVFPEMSVDDNLRVGAISRRARAAYADTLASVFDLFPRLKERRRQMAGTLSGGEQQMLALGRGLMARPRLLLLDEPTLGLAPGVANQIFDLLPEMVRIGVTILIAEQDARRTLTCADDAYVLENGRVTINAPGLSLLDNPEISKAYLGM